MITQGTWEVLPYTQRDGNNIRWVAVIGKKRRKTSICQTFKPHAEANARLIAAAPELLDFAQEFFTWHANHFGDFDDQTNNDLLSLSNEAEAVFKRLNV